VKSHGFTLIELMIVVIIMGLLASIAYPAYQEQVMKTRRAEGQSALLHLATAIEHYYTVNLSYSGATSPSVLGHSATSTNGHYTLTISDLSDTTYTLSATPAGAQAGDSCGVLTLNQAFVQTPTNCW
tara:strand:+ start:644 stop:1024 length:381 start_codon:yes stop_codon:yes gene_type:complete